MSIWKVSFDFQFKMKVKIEKIVTFDFDPNIESRILFYFISFSFFFVFVFVFFVGDSYYEELFVNQKLNFQKLFSISDILKFKLLKILYLISS